MTVFYYYHVTYVFQSESTLYSFLNVKERLAQNRHNIWSLSHRNGIQTHNHLVLVCELSGCRFEFRCCHLKSIVYNNRKETIFNFISSSHKILHMSFVYCKRVIPLSKSSDISFIVIANYYLFLVIVNIYYGTLRLKENNCAVINESRILFCLSMVKYFASLAKTLRFWLVLEQNDILS